MPDTTDKPPTSRHEEVHDPAFVEGLEELPLGEVRRRRDLALAEREYQSYLRRLIQVRQDMLEAERGRRASGGEEKPMVERITEVLSEGPQGRGRGEALRLELSEQDIADAERDADEILGDAAMADPQALDDDRLQEALLAISEHERAVSADRAAVLRVHDRLQEELKRRYREDPSQALEAL